MEESAKENIPGIRSGLDTEARLIAIAFAELSDLSSGAAMRRGSLGWKT
jgi:hypothetical protein